MNTLTPSEAREAALAASYALARHIPDMARGFTIGTNYGELTITADEAARHPDIRHSVESILKFRLHAAERAGGTA